jgi:acyl dehydratase
VASRVSYADVGVGTQIPASEITLQRLDVLRYCGACGDFAAPHWSDRIARSVGLPGVIAHGTLTMAGAVQAVTDWVGDPGALASYRVRGLSYPVAVPDDGVGTTLRVSGVVEDKLDGNLVTVRLSTVSAGRAVMFGARAVVQLA